ncbi:hypothetical protein BKA65DRAFT_480814 [Rhexocercosporidium sp. MPI-PUGE-AT-0058]|nr:hypothetical protein BKA65DRAFT_480814 [Rhexocercosporidium sp. MPI-PUGE-AT-0058]
MPRFYTGWPCGEMDRTLHFEDAFDFEGTPDAEGALDVENAPDFEDNTLNLEDTLSHSGDSLDLEVDAGTLEELNAGLGVNYWDRNENKKSILLLSKQISGEALDILYGDNIFKLQLHGEGEHCLKKKFAEGNSLWVFPTSQRGWRIVTEQPVEASSYHGAPSLEQEIDRWVKWIKPFLHCCGQYLSRETVVQVDIDGRAETRELVKECLPHGYREIRCRHVGDLIFKRGRFSWDSGY